MRKVVIGLIIAAFFVSAGAYVYYYQPFKGDQRRDLESVLSAQTLALVRVIEPVKQIDRFKTSRMGQALAKIDIPGMMELLEAPAEERAQAMEFIQTIQSISTSTWFDVLFGQEVVLALQPLADDSAPSADPDSASLLEAVILVTRPRQPARVIESLNSMFSRSLDMSSQAYKNWEIKTFTLQNGLPVYYALSQDLLLAGFSSRAVEKGLDQSLNEATSLFASERYRQQSAALLKTGQTDMLVFADVQKCVGNLVNKVIAAPAGQEAVNREFDQIKGVQTFSMAVYDDGGPLVHTTVKIALDRQDLSPMLANYLGHQPQEAGLLARVPAGALFFSWQNTLDPNQYWKQIVQDPDMKPEALEELKQQFLTQTGMPLEEVLTALGPQVAMLINDINTNSMFPIPELAVVLQTGKPEIVDHLLKRLAQQFGMQWEQEEANGVKVSFLMLPVGADLSPAYACKDGFCTLAVNRRLLQDLLGEDKQNAVATHVNFQMVNRGLTDPNNSVSYLNHQLLVSRLRELTVFALNWMALARPEEIEKYRKIADMSVYPLLEGLTMIKAIGTRTFQDQGGIQSDIYTALDRP